MIISDVGKYTYNAQKDGLFHILRKEAKEKRNKQKIVWMNGAPLFVDVTRFIKSCSVRAIARFILLKGNNFSFIVVMPIAVVKGIK